MSKTNNSDRGRRKYFADYPFQDVPKKNGKGTKSRRVYAGKYFSYVIPEDYSDSPATFISRIKGFYAAITVISALLWLAGSLISAASHLEDTVYVVAPYVLVVIPIALILFTVVEFIFTKKRQYERSFADALSSRLRMKTIFAMLGAAFCALSEIVYIIIKASSGEIAGGMIAVQTYAHLGITSVPIWHDVIYAAAFIVLALLAFFFLKLQDSLKIEPV